MNAAKISAATINITVYQCGAPPPDPLEQDSRSFSLSWGRLMADYLYSVVPPCLPKLATSLIVEGRHACFRVNGSAGKLGRFGGTWRRSKKFSFRRSSAKACA